MATKEPLGYANGKSIQAKSSEALQTIVEIRRNYTTKLEEACLDYILRCYQFCVSSVILVPVFLISINYVVSINGSISHSP